MLWNTAQVLQAALWESIAIVAFVILVISVFRGAAVRVCLRAEVVVFALVTLRSLIVLTPLVSESWHVRHPNIARSSSHRRIKTLRPSLRV
jgi:hypothetical protein